MTCLSNPTMFFINEICFSIGVNEILLPLAQQSISRSPLDRMTRISGHLLEQSKYVFILSFILFIINNVSSVYIHCYQLPKVQI